MTETNLHYMSAIDIAQNIKQKQLSPVEVTEAFIARIEACDPALNAYCTPMFDIARDKARVAEKAQMSGETLGPLHGVPYAIKDSTDYEGVRTTTGSIAFKDNIAKKHSPLVGRLDDAGGIPLGKTTTPDLAWKALTDSKLFGVTHNPWNLDLNPGGSSGGSAAAVATGMAPIATGTDGAGSIRVPAAFCGIFGHKPSHGRVPLTLPNFNQHTHEGPMTRTVSDAALMLDIMAGPHDTDQYSLEGTGHGFLKNLDSDLKGKKIAWSPRLGYKGQVHPEILKQCEAAALAFEELGCTVEEVDLDLSVTMEVAKRNWQAIMSALVLYRLPEFIEHFDPALVACAREAENRPVGEFLADKLKTFQEFQKLAVFFHDYDLLLSPTVACLPITNNHLVPEDYPDHPWDWLEWAPYSSPFNVFHNPAASVPVGFSQSGLPIGLQIVGPRLQDLAVLQAAKAFETIRPWAHIHPNDDIILQK